METSSRIEPCFIESHPPDLSDVIAEIVRAGTSLGARLHPRTAAGLSDLVAIMNCYYSNLIEGHHTRPKDIERALVDDLDVGGERRNFQLEARSHVKAQRHIDELFSGKQLGEPASMEFLRDLHRRFYQEAPEEHLRVGGVKGAFFKMTPGEFRHRREHDNVVGRHQPPSSVHVAAFMDYFERQYRLESLGPAQRIVAMAAAHHRFNYIHPFPDGNGRVSRLMSHAMALKAGIGAHGLWSVSRGLARGLTPDRGDYKRMMDAADAPRRSDTDGRGNLSASALLEFVRWFCKVALDQLTFMGGLLEFETLRDRIREYVTGSLKASSESAGFVDEVFRRGSVPRGEVSQITGRPERTARQILRKLLDADLLDSETPRGDVYLRFSSDSAEYLFPRLFPPAAQE